MTVVEGDPPARQVALLPYRLSAPLDAPAAAMVVAVRPEQQTEDAETDAPVDMPVTIPAGTTSGTVPVPVDVNRAYDGARTYAVMAFAIHGVATDEWSGAVRVNDNEVRPTVRATITRDRTAIHTAFRSTGRTSYRRDIVVKLTRGTSGVRALRVGQVSRGFVERYATRLSDAETAPVCRRPGGRGRTRRVHHTRVAAHPATLGVASAGGPDARTEGLGSAAERRPTPHHDQRFIPAAVTSSR